MSKEVCLKLKSVEFRDTMAATQSFMVYRQRGPPNPNTPKSYLNFHPPSTHPTLSTSTFQHHLINPHKTSPPSLVAVQTLPQPKHVGDVLQVFITQSIGFRFRFLGTEFQLMRQGQVAQDLGHQGVDGWGGTKQNTVKLLGNVNLKWF